MDQGNKNSNFQQQTFLHYQVLRELGQGGMGKVYQVYDTKLKRQMALKVLLAQGNELAIKRFLREGEAVAQLQHPNIVKVYGLNFYQNNPYILMEYIEGQTLLDYIKARQPALKHKIEIILKIIQTIAYAHKQGILHRDIKPDNIIIDKDGKPYLMDFGLAKLTRVDKSITRTGQILGTPKYMSPEQALGETRRMDHRADIYSLGAVLYEIITGKPVVPKKANLINIIDTIVNGTPKLPRDICPQIAINLEAICIKAIEKEPKKRYQTAEAMVQDLLNYLNGKKISAPKVDYYYKLKKYLKSNLLLNLCVVAVFFVVVLLFFSNSPPKPFNYIDKPPKKQLKYATTLITQGKFKEARKVLENIISHYPKLEKAYVKRANLFANQRKFNKALRDVSEAIQRKPLPEYYHMRSQWLLELSYKDEAVADLTKALKIVSDLKLKNKIHKNLADLLLAKENYQQAKKHYQLLPPEEQNNQQTQIKLIKCYYHLQQSTAIQLINKIIDNSNSNSSAQAYAFYYKGLIHIDKQQKALSNLKKAARLTSKNIEDLFYFLGLLYFKTGAFKNAQNYLTKHQKLFPKDIKALEILAICYQKTQQYDKAIYTYTRCIQIKPWELKYYEQRGVCYSEINDFINSEQDYLKCLQIFPEHFSALNQFIETRSKQPIVNQIYQTQHLFNLLLGWRRQYHSSELELFENEITQLRQIHIENFHSPVKKKISTKSSHIREFVTALLESDSSAVHEIAYSALSTMPFNKVMHIIKELKSQETEKIKQIIGKIKNQKIKSRKNDYRHLLVRYYIGRDDEAINKIYQDKEWNTQILHNLLRQEKNGILQFLATKALISIETLQGMQIIEDTLYSDHSLNNRLFCFVLLNKAGMIDSQKMSNMQAKSMFWQTLKCKQPFVRLLAARHIPIDYQIILQNFLADQDIRVKMQAARRLWRYGNKQAGKLLSDLFSHPNDNFRFFAVKAFWNFEEIKQSLTTKKFTDTQKYAYKIATKSLNQIADDSYYKIRQYAINQLAKNKNPQVISLLKKSINDPRQEVQFATISALTNQGKLNILSPIMLDDKRPLLLRIGAITEITMSGNFLPFLQMKDIFQKWTKDNNPIVRMFSTQITQNYPGTKRNILRELHQSPPSRQVSILISLIMAKPPKNIETIIPLLTSHSPKVRRTAAATLAFALGGDFDHHHLHKRFTNGDKEIREGAASGYSHTFYYSLYKNFVRQGGMFNSERINAKNLKECYLQQSLKLCLTVKINSSVIRSINTALDRAIQLQPKNSQHYFYKSITASLVKDYLKASLYTQKSIDLEPSSSVYRYWLAQIYYYNHQYDKALTSIEKYPDIYPFSFEALLLKGEIYEAMGNVEQSQYFFKAARISSPANYSIYLITNKHTMEAGEVLVSLPKDQITPDLLLSVAIVYLTMGLPQQAIDFLKSRRQYCVIDVDTWNSVNRATTGIFSKYGTSILQIYK